MLVHMGACMCMCFARECVTCFFHSRGSQIVYSVWAIWTDYIDGTGHLMLEEFVCVCMCVCACVCVCMCVCVHVCVCLKS